MLRRAAVLLFVLQLGVRPAQAANPPRGHSPAARRDLHWLETGFVESAKLGDEGINSSIRVGLMREEGRVGRAIFKAKEFEAPYSPNIPRGTYHLRERATSRLADLLGVDFVPKTVLRQLSYTVRGQLSYQELRLQGSIQEWAEGAERSDEPGKTAKFDLLEGQKLMAFDYLIGNEDRHEGNLLARVASDGRVLPVAIDNGMVLPLGINLAWKLSSSRMLNRSDPVLEETRAFIQGIDKQKVAEVLARSGIERDAIVHVLRRLARLKAEPGILPDRLDTEGKIPDQRLDAHQLEKANAIVDAAMPLRALGQLEDSVQLDLAAIERFRVHGTLEYRAEVAKRDAKLASQRSNLKQLEVWIEERKDTAEEAWQTPYAVRQYRDAVERVDYLRQEISDLEREKAEFEGFGAKSFVDEGLAKWNGELAEDRHALLAVERKLEATDP